MLYIDAWRYEDVFIELPISDFYLECGTLFVSCDLADTLTVQLYPNGFRCLANDVIVNNI